LRKDQTGEIIVKKYVDMYVLQTVFQPKEQIDKILEIISELGFSIICVTLDAKKEQNIFEEIKKKAEDFNIEVYRRINLSPKNVEDLKNKLRQFRRKCEILTVKCLEKKICTWAARDRRVDILNFPFFECLKNFTEATANLAVEGDTAIEIWFKQFLDVRGIKRARLIAEARRVAKIALKKGVKIIIDSGAENIFEMRSPRELGALGYLLDIPEKQIELTVSENPLNILRSNLSKLSPNFVLPGVEIVGEEEENWLKKKETDT